MRHKHDGCRRPETLSRLSKHLYLEVKLKVSPHEVVADDR